MKLDVDWKHILTSLGYPSEQQPDILTRIDATYTAHVKSLFELLHDFRGSDFLRPNDLPEYYLNQPAPTEPLKSRGNVLLFSDRLYYLAIPVQRYFALYSPLNVIGVAYDYESARRLVGKTKIDLLIEVGLSSEDNADRILRRLRRRHNTHALMWSSPTPPAKDQYRKLKMDIFFDRSRPLSELTKRIDKYFEAGQSMSNYLESKEEAPRNFFLRQYWRIRYHKHSQ